MSEDSLSFTISSTSDQLPLFKLFASYLNEFSIQDRLHFLKDFFKSTRFSQKNRVQTHYKNLSMMIVPKFMTNASDKCLKILMESRICNQQAHYFKVIKFYFEPMNTIPFYCFTSNVFPF